MISYGNPLQIDKMKCFLLRHIIDFDSEPDILLARVCVLPNHYFFKSRQVNCGRDRLCAIFSARVY